MPFPVDFYGQRYDRLWVSNNGNVTFDAPLSEYTPFGLKATSRAIIAPFFADVDTRASGSNTVKYGWGTTTFEGQPAFCANWVDVGYYNQHADKLNSFQLLLVQRAGFGEADFDIVFNYGTINWETGDASGGSNGFGGDSARVGFSNGDGTDVNSFEPPGSGIDGTLLDSNFSRGLIRNAIGSGQDGRYIFRIRNGIPAPSTYVAMGDSYQSGEGAGSYDPDTDIDGVNQCHRSSDAYPERLVRDGVVPYTLDLVACSGAEMPDLTDSSISTTGPPWNEGAQFSDLNDSTALATLGIGGNDLGFGPTLADCIRNHYFGDSCEEIFDAEITDRLIELQTHGFDGLNALQRVYDDARSRAWRARTLVLGYPRFFTQDGGEDWTGGPFGNRCQSLRLSDQVWINFKIRQLNAAIEASARSMGAEFVDLYDVPEGVELCSPDEIIECAVRLRGLHGARGGPAGRQLGQGRERGAGEVLARRAAGPDDLRRGLPEGPEDRLPVRGGGHEVTETVTAGGSTLTYDPITGTYHYVWKTDRAWAGTCRRLVLGLDDSSSHSADFRLK